MYNKRKFNKINDKKVLHKVKKQWVTISLALFMMIGGGALATHTTASADVTNNNHQNQQQVNLKLGSKKGNNPSITNQAKSMHNTLVNNVAKQNIKQPRVHKFSLANRPLVNNHYAKRVNSINKLRTNKSGNYQKYVYKRINLPFWNVKVTKPIRLHSSVNFDRSYTMGTLPKGDSIKINRAFKEFGYYNNYLRYEVKLADKRNAFVTGNKDFVSYIAPSKNYKYYQNRINHLLKHTNNANSVKLVKRFNELNKHRKHSLNKYINLYELVYNTQQRLRHPVIVNYHNKIAKINNKRKRVNYYNNNSRNVVSSSSANHSTVTSNSVVPASNVSSASSSNTSSAFESNSVTPISFNIPSYVPMTPSSSINVLPTPSSMASSASNSAMNSNNNQASSSASSNATSKSTSATSMSSNAQSKSVSSSNSSATSSKASSINSNNSSNKASSNSSSINSNASLSSNSINSKAKSNTKSNSSMNSSSNKSKATSSIANNNQTHITSSNSSNIISSANSNSSSEYSNQYGSYSEFCNALLSDIYKDIGFTHNFNQDPYLNNLAMKATGIDAQNRVNSNLSDESYDKESIGKTVNPYMKKLLDITHNKEPDTNYTGGIFDISANQRTLSDAKKIASTTTALDFNNICSDTHDKIVGVNVAYNKSNNKLTLEYTTNSLKGNTSNSPIIRGIYDGLNFKYYKAQHLFEFTNGTLTWNGVDNFNPLGNYTDYDDDMSDSFIINLPSLPSGNEATVNSIKFDSDIDTSHVTNMHDMFAQNSDLKSIDLGNNFNTSNVSDMSGMFYCINGNLSDINLGKKFNTSHVTNMHDMFNGDNLHTSDLNNIISQLNTDNVTNMSNMFSGFNNLEAHYNNAAIRLNIPTTFHTNKVINMSGMFSNMPDLEYISIPDSFNTTNVINMSGMFNDDINLKYLVLPNSFVATNNTNINYMFGNNRSLQYINLPVDFDTRGKSITFSDLFSSDKNLQTISIKSPNTIFAPNSDNNNVYSHMYLQGNSGITVNLYDGGSHVGTWEDTPHASTTINDALARWSNDVNKDNKNLKHLYINNVDANPMEIKDHHMFNRIYSAKRHLISFADSDYSDSDGYLTSSQERYFNNERKQISTEIHQFFKEVMKSTNRYYRQVVSNIELINPSDSYSDSDDDSSDFWDDVDTPEKYSNKELNNIIKWDNSMNNESMQSSDSNGLDKSHFLPIDGSINSYDPEINKQDTEIPKSNSGLQSLKNLQKGLTQLYNRVENFVVAMNNRIRNLNAQYKDDEAAGKARARRRHNNSGSTNGSTTNPSNVTPSKGSSSKEKSKSNLYNAILSHASSPTSFNSNGIGWGNDLNVAICMAQQGSMVHDIFNHPLKTIIQGLNGLNSRYVSDEPTSYRTIDGSKGSWFHNIINDNKLTLSGTSIPYYRLQPNSSTPAMYIISGDTVAQAYEKLGSYATGHPVLSLLKNLAGDIIHDGSDVFDITKDLVTHDDAALKKDMLQLADNKVSDVESKGKMHASKFYVLIDKHNTISLM